MLTLAQAVIFRAFSPFQKKRLRGQAVPVPERRIMALRASSGGGRTRPHPGPGCGAGGTMRIPLFYLGSQYLIHGFTLCQFIDQFVQIADFPHGGFLDFFNPNTANDTGDFSP